MKRFIIITGSIEPSIYSLCLKGDLVDLLASAIHYAVYITHVQMQIKLKMLLFRKYITYLAASIPPEIVPLNRLFSQFYYTAP